jgi:hypothetical protein
MSFSAEFTGSREEFEQSLIPYAGVGEPLKMVQLIAITNYGKHWNFNGSLFFSSEESSLILTPQEAKFLGSLALTNAEISKRVGIHPTDQFRLFSNAQRKNNLAKDELIMAAFEEKLIDMRPLDTRDLTVLTPKEIHMMHRCVQDSSNGPKQRHNSIAQLRATGILQKLGNISYEQLLLLGLRDGIVSRGVGATRLTPDE